MYNSFMKNIFQILLFVMPFTLFSQAVPEEFEDLIKSNPELVNYIKSKEESSSIDEGIIGDDKSIDDELDQKDEQVQSDIFGVDYIKGIPKSISSTSDLPVPNEYVVSLGDKLKIILTGGKEDIFSLEVGMDGSILFPELGSINVFGESIKDVRQKIKQIIELSYDGVGVSVSLETLSAKKINIIGAVKNPGTYIVSPFSTITSSLAYSGGFEDYASLRNIVVIRQDEVINFDLYDFLIFGSRKSDINIQQGDTISIQSTNNFVEIKGAVNRPKIYEYLPSDRYSDLIKFALGLNKNADEKNITATINKNGDIVTERINNIDLINNQSVDELFVGNKVSIDIKDIFVSGNAVTSGFYISSDEKLDKFLEKLKFSDDIYPFYGIHESINRGGLTKSRSAFSLSDPNSYSDLRATKNTKIYFLDREEAINYDYQKTRALLKEEERKAITSEEKLNIERKILESSGNIVDEDEKEIIFSPEYEIDPDDFVSIFLPNKSFRVPLKGKISPKQLHLFFGSPSQIDLDNVSIITSNDNFTNAYEMMIDSEDLVAISFPSLRNENLIEVEIIGEVANPGKYSVASSTTLIDLYILAGGLRENAFEKGIVLTREDIKQKQIKAIREAKSILTDTLIQKSNSVSEKGMVDIESIIAMADLIEPNGRISGEFSQDSDTAKEFILKDGDIINIPSLSYEVVVQGEVLNSSSFIFDESMSHQDYIAAAGGFSDYADKRAVFIIKANGASIAAGNNIFAGQTKIEPGDTIVVPRNLDQLEALPLISIATKIIADIAFSAASLNALQD